MAEDDPLILLWGTPRDEPMALVMRALDRRCAPFTFFEQEAGLSASIDLEVGEEVGGTLRFRDRTLRLDAVSAAFIRPQDSKNIASIVKYGDEAMRHATQLDDALLTWADLAAALVVNRPASMGPNSSKPYQAALIHAAGFNVPETLLTTDEDAAREFVARNGRVIFKSISGVRTIVTRLRPDHWARARDLANCPIQLQAFVPGVDVRAHVVGNRVFACSIESGEDDYRYPHRGPVRIVPYKPSDIVAEQWVRLAATMGLVVAGIDLRLDSDGRWVCFEVNPAPAFSYYQSASGQLIDRAIVDLLIAADGT